MKGILQTKILMGDLCVRYIWISGIFIRTRRSMLLSQEAKSNLGIFSYASKSLFHWNRSFRQPFGGACSLDLLDLAACCGLRLGRNLAFVRLLQVWHLFVVSKIFLVVVIG